MEKCKNAKNETKQEEIKMLQFLNIFDIIKL